MTTNITAMQESVPVWDEVRRAMPIIARELGTDDLHLMEYHHFPHRYMDTKHRDLPVKMIGFSGTMPFCQNQGMHASGPLGYGIAIYQSKLAPELKYALYNQKAQWNDLTFIVMAKKEVFRLSRIAQKLDRLASLKVEIPILEDGIVDEVLDNTIRFLKFSKQIEQYGVKIKRGLLLDGPPGNGKTMLCRYIQKLCSQRNIHWGIVDASDIDKAFGEQQLPSLFNRYTVTFFDDIDVSYMNRKAGNGKLACSLLTAMDGMHQGEHLVRIFTTNETVDNLDPAFTRPGRIDQIITLHKPTADLRRQLVMEVWPQEIVDAIDVEKLVKQSDDFSFAEVEAIRTFLVTNKVVREMGWDLEAAFEEFECRKEEEKESVGFNKTEKKRRKKRRRQRVAPPCDEPAITAEEGKGGNW